MQALLGLARDNKTDEIRRYIANAGVSVDAANEVRSNVWGKFADATYQKRRFMTPIVTFYTVWTICSSRGVAMGQPGSHASTHQARS